MENSPVVDNVRFNDDVCVAMFHWLISCSLSVDLNIKSPHPNFSEINTTTTNSKMLSSTSTFLLVLEAIALLIVHMFYPTRTLFIPLPQNQGILTPTRSKKWVLKLTEPTKNDHLSRQSDCYLTPLFPFVKRSLFEHKLFPIKICLKGGLSHWEISCIVCIVRLKKGTCR